MKTPAARFSIDVRSFNVLSDGSGAPAVIQIADYVFACDYLKGVRVNCIKPGHGSRTESKIAAERVSKHYAKLLTKMTPDWLELNHTMYADL